MDLSTRLRALQKSVGQTVPPLTAAPPSAAPASADGALPARPATLPGALDQREQQLAMDLGGQRVMPGLLLVEQPLGLQPMHGGIALAELATLHGAALGQPLPPQHQGWWFMDTETTGLAGGTGTLVFLYGGLHFDGLRFTLRQWVLSRLAGEPHLVARVASTLQQNALLVTFNGKSFDLPLLRTRARLLHCSLPEQHLAHLDLLHPARSAYAQRWPDVRLQTAERRLCQFRRHDDLPGSEAPQAFMQWLRSGDSTALQRVVLHHRHDVLSLAALTIALARAYAQPHLHDADPAGIVRRLRRQGYRVREGQAQLAFAP